MTERPFDFQQKPFVINIEDAVKQNESYRQAIWSGSQLQVFVMAIGANDESGMEIHRDIDQFIRIESGEGLCKMGPEKDVVNFERTLEENDAIFIPANTWHNIINTSGEPLRLYTIYSGKQFAEGTVHKTRFDAQQLH